MKHKAKSSSSGTPSKGKGAAATRGAGKGKVKSSSSFSGPVGTVDLRDLPLSLPDISVSEHAQWVPRYHAVLRRSEHDGVTMEDLDTLQLEMEAMLAATVAKKNSLVEEVRVLDNVDKYRSKAGGSKGGQVRKKHATAKGPDSPGKRHHASAVGSSTRDSAKRFRANNSSGPSSGSAGAVGVAGAAQDGGAEGNSGKVIGLPKVKSAEMQSTPHFDPLQNEQVRKLSALSHSLRRVRNGLVAATAALPPPPPPPIGPTTGTTPGGTRGKPALPKNETPNRFWAFVEPYCAPITAEDIKLLEDLIKAHGDMSEYYRVPPLGQHFTQRWAKEDLENERLKGMAAGESGDHKQEGKSEGEEASKIAKKGAEAAAAESEPSPFGELTQRLVGGLMEENLMTSIEDSLDASKGRADGSGLSREDDKTNLIRSLNVANADNLEARVRKELEEQGILTPGEDGGSRGLDSDEILEELRRCQNELRAVSAHNLAQLRRVLQAAKEELARQELRQRLARADSDVMEAYQKVSAARSKKRSPTKKEREQAWKALKERELILKELETA